MKLQISAAALCLVLIFALSAVNYRCIDAFTAELYEKIDDICGEWDANGDVERKNEEFDRRWQSRQLWLESVVHHALLRDAEDAMAEFFAAAESDDRDELHRTAQALRTALYHIEKMERPGVGNIL